MLSSTISTWLQERQECIVTLHHLCSYRPFTSAKAGCILPMLNEFCELLMDYVSRGHFEIYEKLQFANELQTGISKKMPADWLTKLLVTTGTCLDFNDKYELTTHLGQLEMDLSKLALQLAQR
ncbi:MAG TPA: Rsd/AlgQ family anti-sigma factor, partial [Candidatus Berkiella sp.]|nr:Rsd/AlgQ family anti-sigma factor [Candidatus Berkiella sp.]